MDKKNIIETENIFRNKTTCLALSKGTDWVKAEFQCLYGYWAAAFGLVLGFRGQITKRDLWKLEWWRIMCRSTKQQYISQIYAYNKAIEGRKSVHGNYSNTEMFENNIVKFIF